MSNPNVKFAFRITGNPLLDSLISHLLVGLATLVVGLISAWLNAKGFHVLALQDWLNANGFNIPDLQQWLIGGTASILIAGATIVWSFIQSRARLATAVQAGVNLVLAGAAVTTDGETKITAIGAPDASPPLPVTPAAATKIVQNFGTVK